MKKTRSFALLLMLCVVRAWAVEIASTHFSPLAEGRYFLYNVSQGLYLKASDNPPTLAASAKMVELSANADGTTWQIASGYNDKYLKIGVWQAQYLWSNGDTGSTSWTIEPVEGEEHVYNISTSTFTETGSAVKGKTMYLTGSNASTSDSEDNRWALISQDDFIAVSGGLTAEYRNPAPTEAGSYYLYDVMNRQFLRTDTRAYTSAPAALVTVTPTTGGFSLSGASGKYMKIGVYKGQYLWSDASTADNTVWTIEEADAENVFYIYTNQFTETSSEVAGKTMYLTGTNASSTRPTYGQWALVTPQQYAAARWQSFDKIASQATDRSTYDEAVATALSGLASATTDEERAALDNSVWEALCSLLKNGQAKSGQFDITVLLQNPTFDANASGWTSTHTLNWNSAGVAEVFNHSSNTMSQTLTSMPAGHYTMKVQAFYRSTDYINASANYERDVDNVPASMFFGTSAQTIKNINDDARFTPVHRSSDVAGANGHSIPNSLGGAHAAFEAGAYWNVLRATLDDDGDVSLGLQYTGGLSTNWMPFDNFRLYYSAEENNATATLSATEPYATEEDAYADVTLQRTFTAGEPNLLCLPFDMNASQVSQHFSAAYTVAGVVDGKATLVPVSELKAGKCYVVNVAQTTDALSCADVLLRASAPDIQPVLWEGATLQGSYDGYTFAMTLADGNAVTATDLTFTPIDYADVHFAVNLENKNARAFFANVTYTESSSSKIASYNGAPPARQDQPHTVVIPVPASEEAVTISLSTTQDFADAEDYAFAAGTTLCEIPNLMPAKTYYYKAVAGGNTVSQGSFQTEGHLRMIKASTVSNIRDLGGWQTTDGNRLRYGRIYRGGEMNAAHVMSDADREELLRLGIGAELDLRYDSDISGHSITSSALGADAPYEYLNINKFGSDALAEYTEQFKRAFDFTLTNLRAGRAVYFHCIWGADRTGCYAMLLEGLLGLPVDQMYKDYELTSYSIAGSRTKSGLDSKLNYIKALDGSTLQMKFFNYWRQQVGISATDLLEFIGMMTDGESSLAADVTIDEAATEAPTAAELANVTLQRTLAPAIWNTFSVPFSLSTDELKASVLADATIYAFESSDNTSVSFAEASAIEAGKPYLVKLAGDTPIVNPVFNGVTVVATEGETVGETGCVQFVGQTYDKSLAGLSGICYLSTDASVKALASDGHIKGLRAYFIVPDANAGVKLYFNGETTGIEEMANGNEMVNSKWSNRKCYDLTGRKVSDNSQFSILNSQFPKGLYIIGGRKVLVK